MIYLGPELQQRLLSLFHYSLNTGGYLFLGNSETLGTSQKLFRTLDPKWKIFRRVEFVADIKTVLDFSSQVKRATPSPMSASPERPVSARELTEKLILSEFTSTSILINEKGEMLYVHGHTGKYLEQSTGEASTNILKIARGGLQMPLSTAIRNANAQKKPQTIEGVSVKNEGGMIRVKLTVMPVLKPADMQGLMLVTFTALPAPLSSNDKGKARNEDYSRDQQIADLEQELKSTREYLQTVIEELETTNEELKSANEELQSSNEELQSTNEELQTSKEELQSVNEELVTVNTELHARVDDLTAANNDIRNLMENTQVGIIFLDTNLRIRRFTQSSRQMVDLIPEDIGRPFKQFAHKLRHEDLIKDAQEVLKTLTLKEIEVETEDYRWYILRIMPYRTVDDQIAGVVLTVADVTQLKQAEKALADNLSQYRMVVEASHDGIVHNDIDGNILSVNSNFAKLFGFDTVNEVIESGITTFDLLAPEEKNTALERAEPIFDSDQIHGVEVKVKKRDGTEFEAEFNTTLIRDDQGDPKRLVTFVRDITERKQAETALRESEEKFRSVVECSPDIIFTVDHDLRIEFINRVPPGLTVENVLNTSCLDYVQADYQMTVKTAIQQVFTTGLPTSYEIEARGPNEITAWYSTRLALMPTETDQPQVLLITHDITEQKQAEEALRESEARERAHAQEMEALLDAVPAIVWVAHDPEGKTITGNRAATEFLRMPREANQSITAQPDERPRHFTVWKDDKEIPPEQLPVQLAAQGMVIKDFEEEVVFDDGARHQLIGNASPLFDEQGNVRGAIAAFRDITPLKQAEEALRESETRASTLLNAIPDLIFRLDRQGIFLDYRADESDLYVQSTSIIGKRNRDLSPPDFANIIEQQIQATLDTGEMQVFEYQLPIPKRGIHDYEARMFPSGEDEVIAIVRDITERKQAEEALRESEVRFFNIIISAMDAVISVDEDQQIILFNPAAEKMFGYQAQEMVGKSLDILIPKRFRKDHRKLVAKFGKTKVTNRSMGNLEPIFGVRKSGEEFPIEASISQHEQSGQHIYTVILRDITERKQAEETLRESEERFRAIINSTSDVIFTLDIEQRHTGVYGDWVEHAGLTPEFFLGRNARDMFGPAAASVHEAHNERALAGESVIYEWSTQTDDQVLHYQTAVSPLRGEDGTIYGLVGVGRDITALKQAEAALRENENRLSLAQKASKIGIWDWDMVQDRLIWDERMYEIYGVEPETFGGDHESWQKVVHPDDLAETEARIERMTRENRELHDEIRIVRPSGEVRHIETHALSSYNADGHPLRLVGVNMDITERKQAEEALRESEENLRITLNSIGDAVIATDTSGHIVRINPVAERLSGWSQAEAMEKPFSQVFPLIQAQSREPVPSPVDAVLQTGQMVELAKDTILIAKDGTEYHVADSGAPIQNPKGETIGVVLVLRDVTQQLHTEQKLLKARKLESVGVLAGGIAHDFNNLLTALFGNIEMAKLTLSPTHQSYEYLAAAGTAMERATGLTKQLLTFAKGGAPITKVQDISSLLVEAATFAMHGSKSKVDITIAPDLWPVEVDEGQLSQVINNLMLNAQQAMPNGGVISLSALNVETAGQPFIKIAIQDEGSGIAPENLQKIFDPYFTTKSGNSGLGLATAHSIITKHEGQITVESHVNQGTVFTIHLPAHPEASPSGSPTPIEETPASQVDSGRILVLDDEEAVRALLESMLTRLGYQATLTAEGQATVAAYQQARDQGRPYQAVILDLTIPGGMGGQEVAKKILAIDPQARLVVSSGYATDPIMADSEAYGFKARVEKPYRLAALQQTLQTVLA